MVGKAVGVHPAGAGAASEYPVRAAFRPARARVRRVPTTKEEHPMPPTADDRELFDQLRELLAVTVEDVSAEEVGYDSVLKDDLGVDSLALLELVAAIEDRWQVQVPVDDAARLTTVREIVDHLSSLVPAPAGGAA
jgi:acyl carrier protein